MNSVLVLGGMWRKKKCAQMNFTLPVHPFQPFQQFQPVSTFQLEFCRFQRGLEPTWSQTTSTVLAQRNALVRLLDSSLIRRIALGVFQPALHSIEMEKMTKIFGNRKTHKTKISNAVGHVT